jgi:integron integrase
MKSRTDVLKLVQASIRLRHFAYNTEQAYCHWTGRYYDFCLTLPPAWPAERKAEAFLTNLALKQGVAARTQNQALAALLFLYGEVIRKPLGNIDAFRAKKPIHERTAPSREQVRALRQAVTDRPNLPARLLVDLLYGCGLRVSEPLELRVKDVLWSENQLVIRAAKGGKDRRVPIPACCLEPLRVQLERARQVWESDRRNFPAIGVSLPHQLARKYPSAPRAWQWFWVFPAAGHCAHPRTGETVRYHLLHDLLQRAVREAACQTGLDGLITPHVLRHAYATHSRESIDSLRQLMGHVSIETTAGYMHPVVEKASNPLDDLLAG